MLKIQYSFEDKALLELALTHRSVASPNNERLEFLGDAILGAIITEYLYLSFPFADEGELTRTRASLVNKESLAKVAREIGLGGEIKLGEGEMKSGGWRRDSILSNTLEALIGAIFLDGGQAACREQILSWYTEALAAVDPSQSQKDPKTRLQEALQSKNLPLPTYETVSMVGPAHNQLFTVSCKIVLLEEAVVSEGHSRRRAEQSAAEAALLALKEKSENRL